MVEEKYPNLVIDVGTGTLKAGFATDDAPKYNIPTVVGIPDKTKGLLVGMDQKDEYVGLEALDKAALLDMFYPVERGVITNMDKVKMILNHLVTTEMSISFDEHAVMMTEPPGNPKKVREETVQMM
jgi:actin, other eukaryote